MQATAVKKQNEVTMVYCHSWGSRENFAIQVRICNSFYTKSQQYCRFHKIGEGNSQITASQVAVKYTSALCYTLSVSIQGLLEVKRN